MSERYLTIITNLMIELSTELDLHYEDADLPALAPSIEKLREAASVLEASGEAIPDAFVHLSGRIQGRSN